MIVRQENVAVKTNVKMTLKYFSYEEFESPDLPNSGFANMDRDFLSKLDRAREIAQIPFKINSGYRTDTHNEKVGGQLNSSHRFGYAADIAIRNSRERHDILAALQDAGFNRFGIASGFIHVDNDPQKTPNVLWTY